MACKQDGCFQVMGYGLPCDRGRCGEWQPDPKRLPMCQECSIEDCNIFPSDCSKQDTCEGCDSLWFCEFHCELKREGIRIVDLVRGMLPYADIRG
jgi:hypothetical protein